MQRFLCLECELTISVLPADRLPYRAVECSRLEGFFNQQAEAGSGPDPPPGWLEAGCLRRAWARFQTRVTVLKEHFGLLTSAITTSAAGLWKQMRLAKRSLGAILGFLAQTAKTSLLGDYRCLRLPS